MRIALAFLIVLAMEQHVRADDPGARADAVVDALGVDAKTAGKLRDILFRYDLDLARLERQRVEVRRRLVMAGHGKPKAVESLLDEAIDNQRALATTEEQLLKNVRKLLPAKKAAQVLVLLAATEPARPDGYTFYDDPDVELDPPRAADTDADASRTNHDPEALFPPRVKSRRDPRECDPFSTMHGCRYGR